MRACGRFLMRADTCGRVQTRADACRRVRTRADACGCVRTRAGRPGRPFLAILGRPLWCRGVAARPPSVARISGCPPWSRQLTASFSHGRGRRKGCVSAAACVLLK